MGRITLQGLDFHGFHGLYPEEKEKGNRFTVDVHIDVPFSPSVLEDKLEGTIDYSVVYGLIRSEMEKPRGLLEGLAITIAGNIRTSFPAIERVTVSVSKHNPPIGGTCEKTTVTVTDPPGY